MKTPPKTLVKAIPVGFCQCGCGKRTPIATSSGNGRIKGQPHRFISGHNSRGMSNPRWEDLTDRKYGRLTVLGFVKFDSSHHSFWLCECSCGNRSVVNKSALQDGRTRSCGCLYRESCIRNGKANRTHGQSSHGGKVQAMPTYRSWQAKINRCTNSNNPEWRCYGGANPPVLVCERWRDFRNFLADMGERPEGTTLGRYLDTGDYEPGNCTWQTRAEQGAERSAKAVMRRFRKAFGSQGVNLRTELLTVTRKQKEKIA
jgi:hypothetical protein